MRIYANPYQRLKLRDDVESVEVVEKGSDEFIDIVLTDPCSRLNVMRAAGDGLIPHTPSEGIDLRLHNQNRPNVGIVMS